MAQRARIILLAAKGGSSRAIAREVGMQPRIVSKWRMRFAADGIDALKDKDKASKIGACAVLEQLWPGGKQALAALTEASKSNDDDVRAAAAKALDKVNK